jgi:iron complex outermembrane receptor protein
MGTANAELHGRSVVRAVRTALLLAAATTASDAWAQNAQSTGSADQTQLAQNTARTPPSAQADVLEEVVVTAERRNISLQKTAISATVLTGEDLRKKNVNTVDALQFTTPSLTVQDTGENVLLNIRGIGKGFGGIQDPSGVLIYRDGVSASPGGFLADEPYYDLAGVEVLRGPQGTLAGQNATGGALFIRENDPTLDRVGGWAQTQYGNYNDVLFRGALNLPLSDTFAIRIATNVEHRDSFFHLTGPWSGNPGNHDEADGRISFLWLPTDALKIVLKNDYVYIDHGGSPAGPALDGTAHLFDLTSDAHLMGIEQGERSVLQVSYQFDNQMTLRSIAGYQWNRTSYALDYDGTDQVFPSGTGPMIYTVTGTDRTVSEELNLLSPDEGPLRWLLGSVYQNELVNIPTRGFIQSAVPFGTATTGLATAIGYRTPIEDWGVFGQGTYDLTQVLQLQIGMRYSDSKMSMSDDLQVLNNGVPILDHPVMDEHQSDSRLTGKIGLNVQVSDDSLVYAFVATGHKSGGINPLASTAAPAGTPPPLFRPEEVTDYEIGWKDSFFGKQLRTQLDGFYDTYKDYQVGIFDTGTGLTQLLNVANGSRVAGVEAQAQGVFGGFSFDLNVAYLSSSLGAFHAIDSRNPVLGLQELTGRQLPNAAHWTGSAGVQYAFRLASGHLTPRLDYGLVGARSATVFEVTPIDYLPAQNVFNVQLAYDWGQDWEIAAYATNLFDLKYISSLSLGSLAQAGAPRQFGLRVFKSF